MGYHAEFIHKSSGTVVHALSDLQISNIKLPLRRSVAERYFDIEASSCSFECPVDDWLNAKILIYGDEVEGVSDYLLRLYHDSEIIHYGIIVKEYCGFTKYGNRCEITSHCFLKLTAAFGQQTISVLATAKQPILDFFDNYTSIQDNFEMPAIEYTQAYPIIECIWFEDEELTWTGKANRGFFLFDDGELGFCEWYRLHPSSQDQIKAYVRVYKIFKRALPVKYIDWDESYEVDENNTYEELSIECQKDMYSAFEDLWYIDPTTNLRDKLNQGSILWKDYGAWHFNLDDSGIIPNYGVELVLLNNYIYTTGQYFLDPWELTFSSYMEELTDTGQLPIIEDADEEYTFSQYLQFFCYAFMQSIYTEPNGTIVIEPKNNLHGTITIDDKHVRGYTSERKTPGNLDKQKSLLNILTGDIERLSIMIRGAYIRKLGGTTSNYGYYGRAKTRTDAYCYITDLYYNLDLQKEVIIYGTKHLITGIEKDVPNQFYYVELLKELA